MDKCKYCESLNLVTRDKTFKNSTVHKELFCDDCQRSLQYISDKPLLDREVFFGKHKGKTWGELLLNNKDYLAWLAGKGNNTAKKVLSERDI